MTTEGPCAPNGYFHGTKKEIPVNMSDPIYA